MGLEDSPVALWLSGDARQPDEKKRRGAIPVLVLRALREAAPPAAVEIEAITARPRRMHGRGFSAKVRVAMADAEARGLDGVVFVIDQDGCPERAQELREGRSKGEREGLAVPTAVGVAVEMLEAWLLADEAALSRVLGVVRPGSLPQPESLSDPKSKLKELDEHDRFDGDAVARGEAIAETADLEVLCKRCPKGFEPFRGEVVRRLGRIFTRR